MLEVTFTNCDVGNTLLKLGYEIKRDEGFYELLADFDIKALLSSLTT
jgi:hypothetical protein